VKRARALVNRFDWLIVPMLTWAAMRAAGASASDAFALAVIVFFLSELVHR